MSESKRHLPVMILLGETRCVLLRHCQEGALLSSVAHKCDVVFNYEGVHYRVRYDDLLECVKKED